MAEPARVALVNRASAGIWQYLARTFDKLGISADLELKLRLVSAGAAGGPGSEMPWRGEAEIGLQPIRELIEIEGVDVVGPLPAELQSPDLVYAAGGLFASEQPIAAKALIDF